MLLGTMPGETTAGMRSMRQIAEDSPETEAVDVQIIHSDQGCHLSGCIMS
ncbi:MAG: hypothetical protein ACLTT1_19860 [[Clostridium] scindens]